MTKDLGNLSQIIETRAFLRNQIEEWTKICKFVTIAYAQNTLASLQAVDSLLSVEYQRELKT